jgi:predicted small secreted protein
MLKKYKILVSATIVIGIVIILVLNDLNNRVTITSDAALSIVTEYINNKIPTVEKLGIDKPFSSTYNWREVWVVGGGGWVGSTMPFYFKAYVDAYTGEVINVAWATS